MSGLISNGLARRIIAKEARDARAGKLAYIEQHISSFFGRGMLTTEVINVATEQAFVGAFNTGDATVILTDATQIKVGGCISIKHDNGRYGTYFADSKAVNNIGIRPALRWPCMTASARVERTWFNKAHPGKFYMRELAQRIALSTELEAAAPDGKRCLFTNVASNPNTTEDTLTPFGGATVTYLDASNLGETGDALTPVRFALGRTAYVETVTTSGRGVDTALFDVNGIGQAVVKVAFMAQGPANTHTIQVYDELGRLLGKYVIPSGADQRVMRIYTFPCNVSSAVKVKVRVVCSTYVTTNYFIVDQVDVFEATEISGKIIAHPSAKIVVLGDSWTAGDLGSSAQREPLTTQLALELPYATITNAGVGGNTVSNMLARFDTDVTPFAPDYVVIETGTNECYNPLSVTFSPNAIEAFVDALRDLINKVYAIGARPILLGVPAMAQSDADVPAFPEWQLNDRAKAYSRFYFESMARKPLVAVVATQTVDVTNANGTATKFADGTMVARFRLPHATTAANTLASATWTFPVAFYDIPVVTVAFGSYASNQAVCAGHNGPTSGGVAVKLLSVTGALPSMFVDCVAIGRWRL